MRRAIPFILTLLGVVSTGSFAWGQYPYPYPPMPAPYPYGYPAPTYGYPMPMPGYVPQPMPYPPMMMPAAPMQKVFVLGPLDGAIQVQSPPNAGMPRPQPAPKAPAPVRQVQDVKTLPVVTKNEVPPAACGDDCLDDVFPTWSAPRWDKPAHARGHLVADVGAYLLAPFPTSRRAYNIAAPGVAPTVDFPQQLDYGPRASVGYIFHNGWGARADYFFLTGISRDFASNSPGSGAVITTPLAAPILITSPGATLNAGIGVDSFTFRQRHEWHVADAEVVRECNLFDTTFLFSFGGRYARIRQSYEATRTNPGGVGVGLTVLTDREDVNSSSLFEGWGPTVNFEFAHPVGFGFSFYGNVRGSFLWGEQRFDQSYVRVNRTSVAGNTVFNDAALANSVEDHRDVIVIEPEAGVQWGYRVGRCYLFGRVGAVYHRWWNVGTATQSNGDVGLVGGTARLGIVY